MAETILRTAKDGERDHPKVFERMALMERQTSSRLWFLPERLKCLV